MRTENQKRLRYQRLQEALAHADRATTELRFAGMSLIIHNNGTHWMVRLGHRQIAAYWPTSGKLWRVSSQSTEPCQTVARFIRVAHEERELRAAEVSGEVTGPDHPPSYRPGSWGRMAEEATIASLLRMVGPKLFRRFYREFQNTSAKQIEELIKEYLTTTPNPLQ